ncbi:histidine kinase [Ignavigranum ruoffiae]|uniref:histidine kinase n=1 Tax=Ignavigranum ruoffiae TaxID=89093 RepID=UPI002067F5E9|nr:histidine kinase [Ignavigranum ruoffiae]UPQ85220.1 histidine kinase [Ignavigranum ruoffiae]
MKEKLTDEKVAEIIQARYNSECPRKLTKEQEEQAKKNRKKIEEYRKKMKKNKN